MTAPAEVLARLEELRMLGSLARLVERLDRYDGPDPGFVGTVREELTEALAGHGPGGFEPVAPGGAPDAGAPDPGRSLFEPAAPGRAPTGPGRGLFEPPVRGGSLSERAVGWGWGFLPVQVVLDGADGFLVPDEGL
ncbi:hypothetical protein AB0M43_18465 [Longispora sp. NPDC051575]|uniref:hypothetical protein n=1 Tax=Longispora sp. NPDC051575 TaxID=3154943 RepID=UPI00341BB018